jgi:NAD+ diphosphatase
VTAGTVFSLLSTPTLARSAVLREEPLRIDTARQLAGWPTARLVVVDAKGRSDVDWGDHGRPAGPWESGSGEDLLLRTRPTSGDRPPDDAVLLGEADGVAYWAVRGEADAGSSEWSDLRQAGGALGALGAGLLTAAVAVLHWHDTARFCQRDGSPMRPRNAGWLRVCEAEGHEEYPRTDPAVICLVHDGADRVLLARQPVWPAGRYSVLAGFVEAGESLEACVEREIHEEVGLAVGDITYLGSQAWPFPRSLMVGFHAVADPDQPLVPADGEIEDAKWITRAELREALTDQEHKLLLPSRASIARVMLESWAAHA